jgi:PPOX class probable F420-dependent enzyme
MGDRQMLPVHTKTTRWGPEALGPESLVGTGSFCPLLARAGAGSAPGATVPVRWPPRAAGGCLPTTSGGPMSDTSGSQPAQQMGHGVKQRDLIRMTEEEIDGFLHERRPMTMCTVNHDGSIHAVAMWYGFVDGTIAIETKAKAQKSVNLGRDSRITCMMEDGDYYEELRGVELVGRAEIVEDPDKMWELGVNLFERYYGAYSEELRPFVETMLNKRIVAKINVERTVSWDHRKLGLPSTKPT